MVEQQIQTIMDKNLGTVAQLERFLTHAKLYLRATNTVRPHGHLLATPTPQTVLKPSRHNSFDLSTLYWMGRGDGTWICKKTALLSATELVKRTELKLRSDCPKDFVYDCLNFKYFRKWVVGLFLGFIVHLKVDKVI